MYIIHLLHAFLCVKSFLLTGATPTSCRGPLVVPGLQVFNLIALLPLHLAQHLSLFPELFHEDGIGFQLLLLQLLLQGIGSIDRRPNVLTLADNQFCRNSALLAEMLSCVCMTKGKLHTHTHTISAWKHMSHLYPLAVGNVILRECSVSDCILTRDGAAPI